jgi:two-component system cell cycle response regulator
MPTEPNARFLLASASVRLVSEVQSALQDSGARVDVASSGSKALAALSGADVPSLVLLDANLPGMNIGQWLAALHAGGEAGRFPIVLISDTISPEWIDRLAENVIDDLVPPTLPPSHWRVRLDSVLRTFREGRELEHLRAAALNTRTDPLTGLYNRAALLSMLFCETDRVQRMNTSLCLMLFGVDDFGYWNARLGNEGSDEILRQVVERVHRLLRSYDIFGRVGRSEFALALPGCSLVNAVSLAERIREVFSDPFCIRGAPVRLTAGFGVASSDGRSPVVVLREAEQALASARAAGPESIRTRSQAAAAPYGFPATAGRIG